MSVSNNIDELEKFFKEEGDYYKTGVLSKFNILSSQLITQLKGGNYRSRTGQLRRSIRTNFTNTNFGVEMVPYGYFLSFGVRGKNRNNTFGITPEVARAFGLEEGYSFGSNKVWGINARGFYPLDLEEKIINILTEE